MSRVIRAGAVAAITVAWLAACGGGTWASDTNGDTVVAEVVEAAEAVPEEVVPTCQPVACQEHAECVDGLCLDSREGKRCACPCGEGGGCEAGSACQEVEELAVCLDAFTPLCRPCTLAADCLNNGLEVGAACVLRGDAGSFCALPCPDEGCPAGFDCGSVGGLDLCVPTAGECACNVPDILAAASTECVVRSAAGECRGTRACGPGGLSPCSAAVPVPEDCNGLDDDCDGQTDEQLDDATCSMANQHGTCIGPRLCVDQGWACTAATPAQEACNQLDDDCDGDTDEADAQGCASVFLDQDQDGHGAGAGLCLCAPQGLYTALAADDCDDSLAIAAPGLAEFCDEVDNDCDGLTDEQDAFGCEPFFEDGDLDGHGAPDVSACLCQPEGAFTAEPDLADDCDDALEQVHPGATEVCNGLDDDCDGTTDVSALATCWMSPDWGFRRTLAVDGNLTGAVLKDVQFPVDFTEVTYDNTGLALSLHFDEGTGFAVRDASGNGNDAVFVENAAWDIGKELTALTFDGQNDCLKVPYRASLAGGDAVSVVLWFKWLGGSGQQALISRSDECDSEGRYNLWVQGGDLRLTYAVKDSPQTAWKLSQGLAQGVWHHLAVTVRYSTGEVQGWLDGDALAPALEAGSPAGEVAPISSDLFLGCRWMYHTGGGCPFVGTHSYFHGTLDEVRVYHRVLGAAEVKSLLDRDRGMYNAGDVRFTQDYTVRSMEIAISEIGGNDLDNVQLHLGVTDPQVLAAITRDGRDLRLYAAPTDKPYGETYTGLPFWIERLASDRLDLWVRVSVPQSTTRTLLLYFGDPEAKPVSSFDAVFTKDPDPSGTPDLLVSYHFDELGGQTAQDSSGHGWNALLSSVTFVGYDGGQWGAQRDQRFSSGNSLQFNGTSSQVAWSFPDKDFVVPTTDFSVEFWVQPLASDCGLFQLEDVENVVAPGNALFLEGDHLVAALGEAEETWAISEQPLAQMEWHHVVVVLDGDLGTRLYVDGALAGSGPLRQSGFLATKVRGRIGFAAGQGYFKGAMDEFRFSRRALGPDEVAAHYQRMRWFHPAPEVSYGLSQDRFVGVAQLPYWVESDRRVWVELPYAQPFETTELFLYYGNVNGYPQSSFDATFTHDPDAPDDAGLMAEWHLDTGHGNWMYDDTLGAHDGVMWNFTWGSSDGGAWGERPDVAFDQGSHLVFNGESSLVEVRYGDDLVPRDAFSVEFWVLWSGAKGSVQQQVVLEKGPLYGFAVGNSGAIQGRLLYRFSSGLDGADWEPVDITLTPNAWTHVALTWDGYAIRLYRNGQLAATQAFSAEAFLAVPDLLLLGAGGSPLVPQAFFFGKLDEVRLYDRALAPLEVRAHALRSQFVVPPPAMAVSGESAL